jgi:FAD/FMN-containing dehydrogenase
MTENIVINNPSKKLEELMRKIGIEKHERLERLKKEFDPKNAILL